jgi:hypothetical protein
MLGKGIKRFLNAFLVALAIHIKPVFVVVGRQLNKEIQKIFGKKCHG